ncbi:protein of unknown function [Legionella micdadei]|uniref:Uncharacterized protein n=1 Tax=Legionella micdadei TaxID=451 RepID=A0A098GEU7_LEGMI|nr:hypothetical protein Lmic_1520 [Legionella micdadei]CEG60998.1 protein of unknown function [Legionella micdadei]SCY70208.1 hypothetical protein SAMN02982997_02566 [Legionella micdadei]
MINANALYNECVVNQNITITHSYFKSLFSLFFKFIQTSSIKPIQSTCAKIFTFGISLFFSLKFYAVRKDFLNDN